uniref:Lipoxygenase domain-containing protein n=1 Tax=Cannabis sativa TaxID=3483 RepID=A0A803PZZ2_CANSA
MEWDRVYGYAKYNDLGDPDQSKVLSRKILGGKDLLYPRRGRINRPTTQEGDLKAWMDDEEFEREMIAGVHPVHIRRIMVRDGQGCELAQHYPYALDGLLIWEAIHTWVKDYCNNYYNDNKMVQKDKELQHW